MCWYWSARFQVLSATGDCIVLQLASSHNPLTSEPGLSCKFIMIAIQQIRETERERLTNLMSFMADEYPIATVVAAL